MASTNQLSTIIKDNRHDLNLGGSWKFSEIKFSLSLAAAQADFVLDSDGNFVGSSGCFVDNEPEDKGGIPNAVKLFVDPGQDRVGGLSIGKSGLESPVGSYPEYGS